MPTKRKFSAKFPTARIKKIMQLDDEIGKLSATVPPVVSRALELFIEQLLTKAYKLTISRNAKTISPSYLREIIENEEVFSFLKPLVANIALSKSPEDPKSRLRPTPEGNTNGSTSRKRRMTESSSGLDSTEESGPSYSSKNSRRKKYSRSKNQRLTRKADSGDS